MSATVEERLAAVEAEVERLSQRLATFDRLPETPRRAAKPSSAGWRIPERLEAASRPLRTKSASSRVDIEDLLGGRLLAIVGGAAVLLGLAFFVALAIDHGWIGETARVAAAFGGAALLTLAGIVLAERRARAQAALAIVGTGIAGLFLTLTAATSHYELIPDVVAFPVALAIGALAVALAVRWDSRTLAGLGIVGALAAPVLVGGDFSQTALGFLLIALAGAAGVLVWRRWEWLRIVAFAVALPQVAVWVFVDSPSPLALMLGLAGSGALVLVAALGYEVRMPPAALRPSTSLLVALNALSVAGIGGVALHDDHGVQVAGLWVSGIALVHAVLGIVAVVRPRLATEIGIVLLGTGLVAGNVAFSLLADGVILAVGWAASAAVVGAVARKVTGREELLDVALGGQLTLAAAHVLLVDAPFDRAAEGRGGWSAVLAVALGAFACARLARQERRATRIGLDALSVAALAYVTALVLDGTPLVLAWAAEAAALAELGRRTRDEVAKIASLLFLGLAGLHVLTFEAPPEGLVEGVPDLGAAALASAAVLAAAIRIWHAWPREHASARLALLGFAAVGALYLGSIGIVDSFQPGPNALETGIDVDVRQQGQAALSIFWTVTGLVALWVGLRRRLRDLRLAGFGLLVLATGKVFLYDLSTLSSAWRVLSFIVLGLLLLVAALAYQRARRRDELKAA
jgi:uncharacterized membrane protein